MKQLHGALAQTTSALRAIGLLPTPMANESLSQVSTPAESEEGATTLPLVLTTLAGEEIRKERLGHPETQIPMAWPHPAPQKHDSPNANPKGTAQQTADLTKRCTCAVKSSSTLQHLTFPHDSSLFHTNLTRHVSIRNLLQKLPQWPRI